MNDAHANPKVSRSFSHLDNEGTARMVDVGHKAIQLRRAIADGRLTCRPETIHALRNQALPKGDVLTVAKIAGIQGAKKTSELIPLCHPLALSHVELTFEIGAHNIQIHCVAQTSGQTGVEMEALTGVTIAALTLYDMCKAVDKTMQIGEIHVTSKTKT